jgi:acyl-CoA synthetase (AMP-forming)/AMP-acid ligase II/3-hydroxymyristoyl/3-hydroxydecanoyl-(acyl carrier protein) dehydratase
MTDDPFTLAPLERDRRAPFAIGEAPRSWGDLLDDAARIARHLEELLRCSGPIAGEPGRPATMIMLACADRYTGAAALLAIWHVGAVVALPPNGREETIDVLCAEQGIAILLHDGGGRGGVDLRPWLADRAEPVPHAIEPPRFAPSRGIVCLFTSGSTGAHLACLKTAGQLLGEARLLCQLFDLGPGTRVLATVPPSHIYGLLFGVLVPLMGGGALVRSTPHHAEAIAAEARDTRADVLCSVPAHLQVVAALTPGTLPPLRRVFSSGAPLPAEAARTVAALAGTPVVEVLGSSETGGIAWRHGGGEPLWQPFPGIAVASDEDGVITVRSPFADTPDATQEVLEAANEPAPVRGADRIHLAPDGRFELLGRADGVVKIGGSRIAIAEVERRLLEIPGVREAAVLSVDVPGLRQRALWAVVVAPGLTVAELRAALLRRVDPIAVPRRFRLVETLPREDSGKLVKARLRALFSPDQESTAPAPPVPSSTSMMEASPRRAREHAEVTVRLEADSPFFRGHFEGFPVLPGVVQVNNLVLENARARWPDLGRLLKVSGLKFRNPIRPRDEVNVLLERRENHRVMFEIRRAAHIMSSGALVFAADTARLPERPAAEVVP